MKKYNVHDAKTNLSRILKLVEEGESVYLAKAGKIVAEIKPVGQKDRAFKLGLFKDKITVEDDWDSDEVNQQIADAFYQEEMENPQSPEEIEGEVHPNYKRH